MKLIVLSVLVAAVSASGSPGYQGNRIGARGSGFHAAGGAFGYPALNSARGGFGVSGIHAAGGGSGGGSYGSQDYYANPDYSYGYSVKDPYSGVDIDAQENRYGYQTQGSYGTTLPDGRRQNVNYVVDKDSGFQADVEYYGVARHPHTPIRKGYGQGSHANLRAGAGYGGVQHGAIHGGVQHGAIHGGVQHGAIHGGVQHGAIHGGVQHGAIHGGVQHGAIHGGAQPGAIHGGFQRGAIHGGVSYRGDAGFSGAGFGGNFAGFRGGFGGGSRGGYGGCSGYRC